MAKLSATSREPEEYAKATLSARGTREQVAEQLRELVIEGDRMGGRAELAMRISSLVEAERQIAEAKGRQQQAAEHGLPQHEHALAEREGRETLRAAVMSIAVAAGSWAAALDYDARQPAARATPAVEQAAI
jgi:VIT1/CCC1 family predicted Fe2+/Mn2+ transporter